MYECRKCERALTFEEIMEGASLRCPRCHGRIFEKTRPETTRVVKAR